jgi:ABC-type sugar transport system ATPase subunit
MARVRLDGISKTYGGRVAVGGIDLEVRDGEFMVLFGPAGAGKTTTLKLIAGIVRPDAGSVHIGDRCVDALEPGRRNVAMVFESYALYPQMNVYDNMAFPLRSPLYRTAEDSIRERVQRLAGMMRIDHLLDRPVRTLSNGQKQRVAIGRALVRDADVFLLDEPLSHLDAKLRHAMRAELKEMRAALATTTIYVTHDHLEALGLADRVAILTDGSIRQVGTPDDIYFRPADCTVARLCGDPEINLLNAEIETGADPTTRNPPTGGTTAVSSAAGATLRLRLWPGAPCITLPRAWEAAIADARRTYTVGIRPADIRLTGAGEPDALPGLVYSLEPLGARAILTIETAGGQRVRALVDAGLRLQPDARVSFSVSPTALLLFDPTTQRLLCRG